MKLYIEACLLPYRMLKMLMSAGFGTSGDTQVTSILSEETWPNLRSVGAGTAVEEEEEALIQSVFKRSQ